MLYLFSFVETPHKFIYFGVSTKLNKYIVFTMQTYKKRNSNIIVNMTFFVYINYECPRPIGRSPLIIFVNILVKLYRF